MSELEKKRQELKLLEEQAGLEAEEHALEQVKKHLPHMKVKGIMVQRDLYGLMHSHLSVREVRDIFRMEFEDGTMVRAEMDNSKPHAHQNLLIRHSGNKQFESIEKPMGLQIEPEYAKPLALWEKTAAFMGIKEEDGFEKIVITVQRWWADLEAALVIYMTYMNKCPTEHKRPGDLGYFGHLFSKCHDTHY